MRGGSIFLGAGIAGCVALQACARPPAVVVELFTSEGCSSCPPADAFLTELAQQPGVLPLAFHVTYWDSLGWKDPFSLESATARQRDFARTLPGGEVYTPEMVVNGTVGFVGSQRDTGASLIAQAASGTALHVPIDLKRDGDTIVVTVGAGAPRATLLMVGFDREHRTHVGRGENDGQTLQESNIVRSLTRIGQSNGSAAQYRTPIPTGEQTAALLQAPNGEIQGAAVLN